MLLIFSFCVFGFACGAKGKSVPNQNQQEQGGNQQQQEDEVVIEFNDVLLFGANTAEQITSSVTQEDVGENIYPNKNLFVNSVKMLKALAAFEDLTLGACSKGVERQLDDYSTAPSGVNKMWAFFNQNGDIYKAEIDVIFGYHDISDDYTYDFYYFDISYNGESQALEMKIEIERSKKSVGNNSTANYYTFELSCILSDETDITSCAFTQFDRTEKIEDVSSETINNNYIKNYTRAEFDGENYTISTSILNVPNSPEVGIVSGFIENLNQKYTGIYYIGIARILPNITQTIAIFVSNSVIDN